MLTEHQKARYHQLRAMRTPAATALQRARDFNSTCYARSPFARVMPDFGGAPPDRTRWCEDTSAFRFAGFADEIAGLRHTGWYTDNFQGETLRGAVWQLPGRDREPRFIAGYVDPNNDGAARINFDTTDEARTAAAWADGMAEREAESARDYDSAWRAGSRFAQLGEDVAHIRRKILTALAERRGIPSADAPTLCFLLRERVESLLSDIAEARAERESLKAGDYVDEAAPGFWTGDKDLRAAFNDGAGKTVLA